MPWFSSGSSAQKDDEPSTPTVPVIPMEDEIIHTCTHPFCTDDTCGCHEDPTLIGEVHTAYQDGLITDKEGTDFRRGKLF